MAERFLAVHTDASPSTVYDIERQIIEDAGGRLDLVPVGVDEGELIDRVRAADALLVSSAAITRRVADSMPNCQIVTRYGVGLDTLDIPALTDNGIVVAHFPDFCQPEVANHALMLLLACAKKLVPFDRAVRAGAWRPGPLSPMAHITEQVCGLVAFGAIAREFARRAQAMDMVVIAWDPYVDDAVFAAAGVERVATLEELATRSDFVSIHAPLNDETHHLMSAAEFSAMKPSAFLINTGRGPVVDEAALIAALDAGEIAGAGLDVFETEPLPAASPLAGMDNVVLMPHTASFSDRAFDRLKQRLGTAIVDVVVNGVWPEFVPNRAEVRPRAALASG